MRLVGLGLGAVLVACSGSEPTPAIASSEAGAAASSEPGAEAGAAPVGAVGAVGEAVALPEGVRAKMVGVSWREGCPVGLDGLSLLRVPHLGFDGEEHVGELVVATDVASSVLAAFAALRAADFPIERMRLVDEYAADDDASMADNNTSAFNCRNITGGSAWSAHSYGTAIDINPVQNPYVRGTLVLPPAGKPHVTRDASTPGLITADGAAEAAFDAIAWSWGGRWTSPKDYQHFSKSGR